MHLKKYSYHIFALFLFCGCIAQNNAYTLKEEEGYYTQHHYKLGRFTSLEDTITILESPDAITDFRKKLEDRSSKWRTTGTEKTPHEIWNEFFTSEIQVTIVKKLEQEYDITLLEDYYHRFGNLFKAPTEENEKEVIAASKALTANAKLIQAFKACITARYHTPEAICLAKSTLAYQELLYFILEKPNALLIQLKQCQSNLAKWKEDGHLTGQELWKEILKKYDTLQKSSKLYKYEKNQEVIAQSLRLIDQLANDLYALSYKDLLETVPHGIKLLNDILYEVGLEEKDHIKSLKSYLKLVSNRIKYYLD